LASGVETSGPISSKRYSQKSAQPTVGMSSDTHTLL
jgi:hypothetical protein